MDENRNNDQLRLALFLDNSRGGVWLAWKELSGLGMGDWRRTGYQGALQLNHYEAKQT